MRFRGQNPVYSRAEYHEGSVSSATYGGVALKTGFLLGIIAVIALYFGSSLDFDGFPIGMLVTVFISPIVAIIMVILAHKRVEVAWLFSIIYAVCEGVFLGFISALFATVIGSDIVYNALLATFGVLAGMLFLYSTGLIRVGTGFRRFMYSALLGIVFATLLLFGMYLFGGSSSHVFNSLYITIILVSVVVSSLYLLVDFDNISNIVDSGAG